MRSAEFTAALLAAIVLCFVSAGAVSADDNEIFGVIAHDIEPNILIIFDNSRSMVDNFLELETDSGQCSSYEQASWENGICKVTRMAVAKKTVKNIIENYAEKNRIGIMIFHDNRNSSNGGYIPEHEGRYGTCSVKDLFILDNQGKLKTGRDYEDAVSDYKTYLKALVDGIEPAFFTPLAETLAEAGRYFACQRSLFNRNNDNYPGSGTYPDNDVKAYNPDTSYPPIGHWCRKNYIILMTDGEPTNDNAQVLRSKLYLNNRFLPASGFYPEQVWPYSMFYKSGHPELEDIAGFLYENDVNPHLKNHQNIVTYTIGFSEGVGDKAKKLLQDTADRGMGFTDRQGEDDGGFFFYATRQQDLADAFTAIMADIEEKDSVSAPAVVPVSDKNMAYAGNYGYVSMFKPSGSKSRWKGNLKKYSLNDNNEFASCNTQTPITDDEGNIKDTAVSCWSRQPDGGSVTKGGAGEVLARFADQDRNIYTNLCPDSSVLSLPENAFSKGNDLLKASDFGVSDKNCLIDMIRMADENWKLGDFNHSRPAVAYTDSGDKYVFAGANDGMLHCFDDSDGSELWAFVPKQQFSRLKMAYTGSHSYFMDGSPAVARSANTSIVICGERRGGRNYYAIDITDINNPEYLYTCTSDAQSWKTPQFIKTAVSSSRTRRAFLLTGGYDPVYDNGDSPQQASGNSVYAIDVFTGAEVFRFDHTHAGLSAMKHSIVSAFAADTVDDGKSVSSRIYAGDLGGNVFALRDDNNRKDPTALDGNWQAFHLFSASESGLKIFEEADFVREFMQYYDADKNIWKTVAGDWVFFGTGDRADPLCTDNVDYFYCIKNDWHTGDLDVNKTAGDYRTLSDPGLSAETRKSPVIIDVTDNLIQDGNLEQQAEAKQALLEKYNRGWYIKLENPGEKCLSSPVVYAGVVYFTTFTPHQDSGNHPYDPCTLKGGGTARLYALDYKTGGAVYDYFDGDPEDDLGKDDRCTEIKSPLGGIISSPGLIITELGANLINFPESRPVRDQSGVDVFYWKQRR
jgi:type IV pilus assembly protein PilY1